MVQSALDAPPVARVDSDALIDALLYTVAHDLRSPLLTLSLSGELLTDALADRLRAEPTGGAAIALDALRHGARDLERMLQALAIVSRARRRPLEPVRAPLRLLLGGHIVISDEGDLGSRLVAVDPLMVRELIDAICGEEPAKIDAAVTDRFAVLRLPLPRGFEDLRGAPLVALVESLQRYAGTAVEEMAAGQVIVERQGGTVNVDEAGVRIWLPRADASAPPAGSPR